MYQNSFVPNNIADDFYQDHLESLSILQDRSAVHDQFL